MLGADDQNHMDEYEPPESARPPTQPFRGLRIDEEYESLWCCPNHAAPRTLNPLLLPPPRMLTMLMAVAKSPRLQVSPTRCPQAGQTSSPLLHPLQQPLPLPLLLPPANPLETPLQQKMLRQPLHLEHQPHPQPRPRLQRIAQSCCRARNCLRC